MIRITVEAPDLGQLERELEVVLARLRASRPQATIHVVPSQPQPQALAPLPSEPGVLYVCPDHPTRPMTYKPAGRNRDGSERPAAYWCPEFGCRQMVPAQDARQ